MRAYSFCFLSSSYPLIAPHLHAPAACYRSMHTRSPFYPLFFLSSFYPFFFWYHLFSFYPLSILFFFCMLSFCLYPLGIHFLAISFKGMFFLHHPHIPPPPPPIHTHTLPPLHTHLSVERGHFPTRPQTCRHRYSPLPTHCL